MSTRLVQRLADRETHEEKLLLERAASLRGPIADQPALRESVRRQEFLDIEVVVGLEIEARTLLARHRGRRSGKIGGAVRKVGLELAIVQELRVKEILRQRRLCERITAGRSRALRRPPGHSHDAG